MKVEDRISGNRVDGNHVNGRTPVQNTFFYARFLLNSQCHNTNAVIVKRERLELLLKVS